MMRKKISIILSGLLIIIMGGCFRAEQELLYVTEPEYIEIPDVEPFYFDLTVIANEEIDDFYNRVEIDYHVFHDDGDSEDGVTVVFDFNQTVNDFAFIEVAQTIDGDWRTSGHLYEIGQIRDSDSLILHNFSNLTDPIWSGFRFTTIDGEEGWYVLELDVDTNELMWIAFAWSGMYDFYQPYHDDELDEEVGFIIPSVSYNGKYHTVQAGETLFSIARVHGVTVEKIQSLNNLEDSTHIQIGKQLLIREDEYSSDFVLTATFVQEQNDLDIQVQTVEYHSESTAIGREVLVQSDRDLADFKIVQLAIGDDARLGVVKINHEIGDFSYKMPILISNHREANGFNLTGFSFTDSNGDKRLFAIGASQYNEGEISVWEIQPLDGAIDV